MKPSSPSPSASQHLKAVYAWLMLLPAMLILLAFTHWPAITTLVSSFYSTPKGQRAAVWVGPENYQAMLGDPIFWKSLSNNLWYAGISIPLSIALALIMALWVNERMLGRSWLRMAFFTPTVLPMIAVANIWLFFFTPQYGLLERISLWLGFGSHNWLGDPSTALGAVIWVAVWKEAGLFMIFYLAALQSFNPSLREAASIEGASRWAFFWRVQWPLLMPTTLFVLVNSIINAFRTVDHLFVMTKGGPDNATMLLLYYLYEVGFRYWDTAAASTLTVVIIAILVGATLLQFFTLDKKVHYQ